MKFLIKDFNSDLEILTVEIIGKFTKRSFLVNTWYRPPGSEMKIFDSRFLKLLFQQIKKLWADCRNTV